MKLKTATRLGSEIIIHFEKDGKEEEKPMVCRSVCGGLTFPSADAPGYFMVMGQKPHLNNKRKRPVVIFKEFEADVPSVLYDELIKTSREFLCWNYFADFNYNSMELYESFSEFMRKRDLSRITLDPAALTDWNTSILLIQEWIGDNSLDVPFGGIVHDQLKRMTRDDRKDSRKPVFHAVNALRSVLGSFVDVHGAVSQNVKPGAYKYD